MARGIQQPRLCAHPGHLQKLHAALRSLKVTVAVDERDEAQDDDEIPLIEEVEVAKHVRDIVAAGNLYSPVIFRCDLVL